MQNTRDIFLTRTIQLNGSSVEEKREEILSYFNSTFTLYEKLFTVINEDKTYYIKHEPLRHPLIFYLGHTATFFINKLNLAGYISNRINKVFEHMFAVGVDEMDWDDLNESHYDWPKVSEVIAYRNEVRSLVSKFIKEVDFLLPITWESKMWPILMGIEHERIHLETSSVIIRRIPADQVHQEKLWSQFTNTENVGYSLDGKPKITSQFPINELISIHGGVINLEKSDNTYGWDNEYGKCQETVQNFKASKYLVSNYEYLEFMNDGGYQNDEYWTDEGRRWKTSTKMTHPLFWIPVDTNNTIIYKFRRFVDIVEMPWDWPVETNNLESKAFTNWKAKKTGKKIRLITEGEWHILRNLIKKDQYEWDFGSIGNINLEGYASSVPINTYEQGMGIFDIVGNIWQHTETPIDGFDGFKVHPLYDDFSVPTFDTKHNIIKGGSWISTGNEAIKSSRYAFRRHFYQFAGIRYVEGEDVKPLEENAFISDSSSALELEAQYGASVLGIENFSRSIAKFVAETAQKFNIKLDRVLDVGCSVGRGPFELSKYFKEIVGLDLSAIYFHLAVKLKHQGVVRYLMPEEGEITMPQEIKIENFDFKDSINNVSFYQQDASNIDYKKFNSFDVVVATNLIEKMKIPIKFLSSVQELLVPKGLLIVSSTNAWSTKYTEKENWIGGRKIGGENLTTYRHLKEILSESFIEIQEPLNIPQLAKKNGWNYAYQLSQVSVWQKK